MVFNATFPPPMLQIKKLSVTCIEWVSTDRRNQHLVNTFGCCKSPQSSMNGKYRNGSAAGKRRCDTNKVVRIKWPSFYSRNTVEIAFSPNKISNYKQRKIEVEKTGS